MRGGKTGPAIVAGKPEESLLTRAVSRRHERLKMPPSDPLSETQVADLTAWVKMGAIWPSSPVTAPRRKVAMSLARRNGHSELFNRFASLDCPRLRTPVGRAVRSIVSFSRNSRR